MSLTFNLHPILLDIPRNAVLAIGMPLVLGTLSGLPTVKVANGPWYKVFGVIVTLKAHVQF
jgi:translocator protein